MFLKKRKTKRKNMAGNHKKILVKMRNQGQLSREKNKLWKLYKLWKNKTSSQIKTD